MLVLSVISSFQISLMRKRKLVALLYLSSWCLVTVSVLWLFYTVSWVGLGPYCMSLSLSNMIDLLVCLRMQTAQPDISCHMYFAAVQLLNLLQIFK